MQLTRRFMLVSAVYTLCIMPCLRLGPENESLQNEAERSIFSSKYVFVLVHTVNFLKLYASK